MRKIVIVFLLILSNAYGQNLVPNPSFEDTVSCPTTANQLNKCANWVVSRGTPDYFNACDFITGSSATPQNYCGFQYPYNGDAYIGLYTYTRVTPNDREHVTCQLLSTLTIGKQYKISLYVSLAGGVSWRIASNKIGALFSTNGFTLANPSPVNNYAQIYTDTIIKDTVNWFKVEGSFIADSNYNYLTIGNFFDDTNTDTIMLVTATSYSYYYIDSISLVEDSVLNIADINQNKVRLLPNPATQLVKINSDSKTIIALMILDMEGRQLDCIRPRLPTDEVILTINNLPNGVYFIKVIEHKGKNLVYKLLKI